MCRLHLSHTGVRKVECASSNTYLIVKTTFSSQRQGFIVHNVADGGTCDVLMFYPLFVL